MHDKGPHEFYWQEDSNSYICLAKPNLVFGANDLIGLLEIVVPVISGSQFSPTNIFRAIA
jgi:hypothetical protein